MKTLVIGGLALFAVVSISSLLPGWAIFGIVVVAGVVAFFLKPPKGGGGDWTKSGIPSANIPLSSRWS